MSAKSEDGGMILVVTNGFGKGLELLHQLDN